MKNLGLAAAPSPHVRPGSRNQAAFFRCTTAIVGCYDHEKEPEGISRVDDESAGSVDSLVHSVFQNVRAQLVSFSTGAHLAWAEVRVVAAHAGLFLGLVIVAAGVLLVGWALALLCGALLLVSAGLSGLLAVFTVFLINMIALLAILFYMRHTLKIISFKHTRKALGLGQVELGRTEQTS